MSFGRSITPSGRAVLRRERAARDVVKVVWVQEVTLAAQRFVRAVLALVGAAVAVGVARLRQLWCSQGYDLVPTVLSDVERAIWTHREV